ncbi:hypothetical protein CPB85DRAFT_1449551 [Mucidula mucida]|nr:hypothetical protein CPB85DRAFT_1449551 [Mucidula mucida]
MLPVTARNTTVNSDSESHLDELAASFSVSGTVDKATRSGAHLRCNLRSGLYYETSPLVWEMGDFSKYAARRPKLSTLDGASSGDAPFVYCHYFNNDAAVSHDTFGQRRQSCLRVSFSARSRRFLLVVHRLYALLVGTVSGASHLQSTPSSLDPSRGTLLYRQVPPFDFANCTRWASLLPSLSDFANPFSPSSPLHRRPSLHSGCSIRGPNIDVVGPNGALGRLQEDLTIETERLKDPQAFLQASSCPRFTSRQDSGMTAPVVEDAFEYLLIRGEYTIGVDDVQRRLWPFPLDRMNALIFLLPMRPARLVVRTSLSPSLHFVDIDVDDLKTFPRISIFGVCRGVYFGYVPGERRQRTRGYGCHLAPRR